MPRAYSYLRFSSPEQAKGDSMRRQSELAVSYCAKHGLELDADLAFSDLGVSAYRGDNARVGALFEFLQAVRVGMVPNDSILLVESLDRISWETIVEAQTIFLQIINAGVSVVTLNDEKTFSKSSINANPFDLVFSLVGFMRAHDESATKGRRIRAAWDAKREKASEKPLTTRAPAWLRLEAGRWIVIEDRAAIVRRIFEEASAGRGKGIIAKTFNESGLPTWGDSTRKAGKHWHPTYVQKILDNPAVIGTFTPHIVDFTTGKKVRVPQAPVAGYYPAIIPTELWEAVRGLRDSFASNPLRGRHAHLAVKNILGGLARCPVCDSTMVRKSNGSRKKAGRPHLVCTLAKAGGRCTYKAVPLHLIETAVAEAVDVLAHEAFEKTSLALLEVAAKERHEDLERLDVRIARLVSVITEKPSKALLEGLERLEAEKEELQQAVAEIDRRRTMLAAPILEKRAEQLREAFQGEVDIAVANAALRRMTNRVIVDYREGCLRFDWQSGGVTFLKVEFPGSKLEFVQTPVTWSRPAVSVEELFPENR